MRKLPFVAVLAALFIMVWASPALAQTSASGDESVLVRVNGDVTVPDEESHGVVVVVEGDLDFEGTANTVVIVSGQADLVGATVETLVVVDGTADLGEDTRITGDVHLLEGELVRDPSAVVDGSIERETGDFARGFWVVGFFFMLGWTIMTVLAALALAAVAPDFARRTGRVITADIGPTILAALILWIVGPILGAILFATIVGVPTALTIWLGLLPALWFVGVLVASVRLGEYVTGGPDGIGHPYAPALVGTVLLMVAGVVPVLGPIAVGAAGFLGSGALLLRGFRAVRSEPEPPPPMMAEPAVSAPPSTSAL